MAVAYLICTEGPLEGETITLEEITKKLLLGRDPDTSTYQIDHPSVSAEQLTIAFSDAGYSIENVSTTTPTLINGEPFEGEYSLNQGDIITIGELVYTFSLTIDLNPENSSGDTDQTWKEELSLAPSIEEDWVLKIISGPNAGAQIGLTDGEQYVVGSDASTCDVFLHDLTVSKNHLLISLKDNKLEIEDTNSKNGVYLNYKKIKEAKTLHSNDMVSVGTTTFTVINRTELEKTVYAPEDKIIGERESPEALERKEEKRHWKKIRIPLKHLVLGSMGFLALFVGFVFLVSLFYGDTIPPEVKDPAEAIAKKISPYNKHIKVTYNPTTHSALLVGNVLTQVDMEEVLYMVHSLDYVKEIENNVIIDELAASNTNALLIKNPAWRHVILKPEAPGTYLLKGHVPTTKDSSDLKEFMMANFSYLDQLSFEVAIENNIQQEAKNILMKNGLPTIQLQLNEGDITLSGSIHKRDRSILNTSIEELKKLKGIDIVHNLVLFSDESTSMVDVSKSYTIQGTSKHLGSIDYVIINNKIYRRGDMLNFMEIVSITPHEVVLDKSGIKYRIAYQLP